MQAGIWERETIAASIERLLHEARDGSGGTLFLVGEAGLGKTTMLELARSLAAGTFGVVLGRGDPMEAGLPFGIVSQMQLEQQAGWEPLPLAAPAAGAEAQAGLFYDSLRLLQEASEKPVLMLFDDLHWTDPDSLRLATFLVRRLPALKVAAIATLRPWPAQALNMARHAVQAGCARLETLQPLSLTAAQQLLASRLGRPVLADEAHQAEAAAGGNPLLLEQIAVGLERGQVGSDQQQLLLSRFIAISEREQRYAHAASVFGVRFQPELAAELAGLSQSEADAALEAMAAGGFVRGSAEFVHPLFQQALYDDLPEPVRVRHHAHAFRAMTSRGFDPAEVAEHAIRGRLFGDPDAVAALERAGRSALDAGAVAVARQLAAAAVELAGQRASPGLLAFRAETMLAGGQVAEAIPIYRRILAHPEVEASAKALAHRRLAVGLYVAGQAEESDLELQTAFRTASQNPGQAVQALLDMSAVEWLTRGPARGLELARQGRQLASDSQPELHVRAEAAWGFCAFQCGDPAGLEALEKAANAAERDPVADLSNLDWSWGTLGMYLAAADFAERFDDADRVFGLAFDAAEHLGTPMSIVSLSFIRAGGLVRTGRLAEALELADRADIQIDLTPALVPWSSWLHALALAELGRLDESQQACHRLASQLGPDKTRLPLLRLWLYMLQARFACRQGALDDACKLYVQTESLARATSITEPCVVPWAGEAALTYVSCGRTEAARRVLDWLEGAAAPLPCLWPRVTAALIRAALAEHDAEPAEAERHYEQALGFHAGLPMPLAEARTLLAYGAFLRRRSEPRRARPLFARALELAEGCGAASLADDAANELAAAGGRRLRKVNPDELTAQESRVADLAARGLSNEHIARSLVVSVKTVETHLHHVYDKLGITSRRELILRLAHG